LKLRGTDNVLELLKRKIYWFLIIIQVQSIGCNLLIITQNLPKEEKKEESLPNKAANLA